MESRATDSHPATVRKSPSLNEAVRQETGAEQLERSGFPTFVNKHMDPAAQAF